MISYTFTAKKCVVFGALIFGLALSIYCLVPVIINWAIAGESRIVVGNTRYSKWIVTPIQLFQKIYLFNVTNPWEVTKGAKPILQQVGPIVYEFTRYKHNVTFNEGNDTVFYRENMDFFFRPELSNASLSDWITFVNIPFVGIAHEALRQNAIARYFILDIIQKYPKEQLYVNRTIEELLFGGYFVPFIKEFSELKGEQILPNNTFGLYYGLNGTDQGRFEVNTGVSNVAQFGQMATWNDKPHTDWWEEDIYCNQLNGTDGGLFAPFATKDRIFEMFTPGLCRTIKFAYESDSSVKGIPAYRFPLAKEFFQGAKTNPDNACYCSDRSDVNKCPEDGIFQMGGCNRGPMALSMPHFYQASETYLNQSVGLKPAKELHEWILYIEKHTASPIRVDWRFQMNIELTPNKYFRSLKTVPKMFHPLFWVDQTSLIPDEDAAILRDQLLATLHITKLVGLVGMVAGGTITVVAIIFWMRSTGHCDSVPGEESVKKDKTKIAPSKSEILLASKEERVLFLDKNPVPSPT